MAIGRWSETRGGRVTVALVVALGLVVLGFSLPWAPAKVSLPALTVSVATSSATYTWYSFGNSSPGYVFPVTKVTTNYSAVGSGAPSNLSLWVLPSVESAALGMVGGFRVVVSGAIARDLQPHCARLAVTDWPNSTIPLGLTLLPGGPWRNTSNVPAAWESQSGSDQFALGPGTATFQVALENDSEGPVSAPQYHFYFEMVAQVGFNLPASGTGTMVFSLFAQLGGLSQSVYAAVTIELIEQPE